MTSTSCSLLLGPQRALLALGVSLLALLFLLPTDAHGQGADADKEALRAALREGTHVFRRILFDDKLQPLTGFEQIEERPEETILIVLGDLNCLEKLPGGLRELLKKGGAALIASDRAIRNPNAHQQVLKTAGVRINEETLIYRGGARHDVCYQGLDYCPKLEPVVGAVPDLFERCPLRVATNVPSYLVVSDLPGGVRVLANLPPFCVHDVRGPRDRPGRGGIFWPPPPRPDLDREPKPFAVGGQVGKGRILVLADHSIFINQMMLPDDNNNVEFTYNCLNYLRGDEGQRKRVLLVEDGKVRTDFEVPLKSLKVPPGQILQHLFANRNELVAGANTAIVEAQSRYPHNDLLLDGLDRLGLRGERLARFVALLITAGLLVYGIYRVGARARHSQDQAVPLLSQAVGSSLPATTLPEQRHQAQLRAGNLWSSARTVVRQWFAGVGAPAGPAPRVVVRGNWWAAWRVRRLVGRLWALAYGSAPVRVSPAAYRRLLVDLEDLGESIADGVVRLEQQAHTSRTGGPAA